MPHCGVVRHPFLQQIGSEGLCEEGGCSRVMNDRSYTRTTFACACVHAHILVCICTRVRVCMLPWVRWKRRAAQDSGAMSSSANSHWQCCKNIAVSTHTAQIWYIQVPLTTPRYPKLTDAHSRVPLVVAFSSNHHAKEFFLSIQLKNTGVFDGRLHFYRPVDRYRRSIRIHDVGITYLRIRSISTVNKDSPTWEYSRYRLSIRIHLLENTVDILSTVDFTQKSVEIDSRYGFIRHSYQNKIGRYRPSMCPHTKKKSVDIDRQSGHGLKKIVNIDLTHPYFITNRCKWLTRTLASFHGDQFQAILTKQHTRKKETHTDKV